MRSDSSSELKAAIGQVPRRQQDAGLAYFPNHPLLDPWRSDPRWLAFRHEMGWAPEQLR